MGQAANNKRNASLDEQKRRAAGRQEQKSPESMAIRDFQHEESAKGNTGGATGRDDVANPRGRGRQGGGGGGSGDPGTDLPDVGRSTKRARKR